MISIWKVIFSRKKLEKKESIFTPRRQEKPEGKEVCEIDVSKFYLN